MNRVKQLGLLAIGILAIIGLLRVWSCVKRGPTTLVASDTNGPATFFRPNDKTAVRYNSSTHLLTVATSSTSASVSYVRNPEIHVYKNGNVTIIKHTFGLEHAPFIGLGLGYNGQMNPAVYAGVNLIDAWRFDGGLALGYSSSKVWPIALVGCNVWGNSSLALGYGIRREVHFVFAVRL